jgi:hypothetical protein
VDRTLVKLSGGPPPTPLPPEQHWDSLPPPQQPPPFTVLASTLRRAGFSATLPADSGQQTLPGLAGAAFCSARKHSASCSASTNVISAMYIEFTLHSAVDLELIIPHFEFDVTFHGIALIAIIDELSTLNKVRLLPFEIST